MTATQGKRNVATTRPGARRDALPDYAERARRLGDLIAAPALPWRDVALCVDIPVSTLDMLRAQGRGPKCFRLGRRLTVTQTALREWIDRMATEAPA